MGRESPGSSDIRQEEGYSVASFAFMTQLGQGLGRNLDWRAAVDSFRWDRKQTDEHWYYFYSIPQVSGETIIALQKARADADSAIRERAEKALAQATEALKASSQPSTSAH